MIKKYNILFFLFRFAVRLSSLVCRYEGTGPAVGWRTEAWAWLWRQGVVRCCGLELGCGARGRNPRVSVSKVFWAVWADIILGLGLFGLVLGLGYGPFVI
ncbi:hypothetical protein V6Z11_A10G081900 [Gossypium hirsutum]